MPTLKTALADAVENLTNATDSPALDAEVLLLHVLDQTRSYLRTWPDLKLTSQQFSAYRRLIEQRKSGQPIAYLTGSREFWSRDFIVTPSVLIPRHETELLIELSLDVLPANSPCTILDLGTGSGIIAVTLAAERPQGRILATDISPDALAVAAANAKKHNVDNLRFYLSNWFEQVPPGKFDLIVSNPPYIAEDDAHLQQGDLRFEPIIALTSRLNGLQDLATIAEAALSRLASGGYLIMEHGYDQQQDVLTMFNNVGYRNITGHNDLSGQPRVTIGQYLPLK